MNRDPIETVAAALGSLELRGKTILVACSGGADSTFLLMALRRLQGRFGFDLAAITVNHRIRSEAESSGDSRFVEDFAASLDPAVRCVRKDLAVGEVERAAKERGKGIEEAARHLRYQAFADAAGELKASWVMTGHNRNDRAETVLMRFLSGSGGSALSGIARERGIYFRPLLELSHAEMAEWLAAHGISWREDATNADARYFRNRIRLHLVPLLDSFFPGWETGILSAASRSALDDALCKSLVTARWERSGDGISCPVGAFLSMHPAVRLRFLSEGLSLLAPGHRVPSGYLDRIAHIGEFAGDVGASDGGARGDTSPAESRPGGILPASTIAGSGLVFSRSGDSFFWKPDIVQNSKSGYLVYIRACGAYSMPFGTISVFPDGNSVYIDRCPGRFSLPLTIRTRQAGDTVLTADGKQKTLKKLMNEWSVRETDRDLLPLVEERGTIRAVWGGALGYPDWFVQT
ncbi:MAG TPA: tRNA lysidine(34) synthetase TilS [Treponemataceae bacterium]|nr:tRNA lysidine(34) synthetase TilS [Treponemataceae bacterium]HPS42982.1 tRNA lysidine(34) synthetase TilS [Treponemataceae bacterium]